MGTSVRLPSELTQFLGIDGPQSLLLRGPPGSGKTTLSLALLEAFSGRRILVTSRVPPMELRREFPWLGETGKGATQVIEARSPRAGASGAAEAVGKLDMLLKGDSASTDQLRSFLWLPEAMQAAWAALSEEDRTLLVVDSWDALVEAYLGSQKVPEGGGLDRAEVERLLLARMAEAPVHLVLVLECGEQTQLDYLVNAVVETRVEFSDERLERWLYLRKLRGIRIANAMYPFTLEGGKFECIEPMRPYAEIPSGRAESEPDPMPGHIWPGSTDFAESFGRLSLGGLTLLELDGSAPQAVPYLLLAPAMGAVASQGGPVLILPDTKPTPDLLWKRLQFTLPQKKFVERIRFLGVPRANGGGSGALDPRFARMVLELRPPDPAAVVAPPTEVEEFMRSGDGAGAPSLSLLNTGGMYAVANAFHLPVGPESARFLPSAIHAFLGGRQTHAIVAGRSDDPLLQVMRPLASLQLRVRMRQGRVLRHGTAPWTPNFLLAAGQEHVPYQLLRVV